jgi:hypothetical protein
VHFFFGESHIFQCECDLVFDPVDDKLGLRILEYKTDVLATRISPLMLPPLKCGTSPLMHRSSVDFPDPETPTTSTSSWALMFTDTWLRAGWSTPGYV